MSARPIDGTAAALRQEFDGSFASRAREATSDVEDFLILPIGGDPYAIRLDQIAGLAAGSAVVAVPTGRSDLLGLAGIRGTVVPVFSLSSILGYGMDVSAPRWFVLCGGEETIALGIVELEGHLRVPGAARHVEQQGAAGAEAREVVSTESGVRAVINIPLIVAAIRNRIGHRGR